jgi:DNA mismatch repair protein MSH5
VHLLDGQFQVRPWKEFSSIRGVNKLLSLPFLTSGHQLEEESDLTDESAEPRNAYEFMSFVKGSAHPTLIRWIAAVRLNNFALDETKVPLCVRLVYNTDACTERRQFSAIGALLDHLTRVRAMEGIITDVNELNDILGIESMTLYG